MPVLWTFPNFYHGLLRILLFCTPSGCLTLHGITFYKSTFAFIFGLVPLAGKILRGLENTTR